MIHAYPVLGEPTPSRTPTKHPVSFVQSMRSHSCLSQGYWRLGAYVDVYLMESHRRCTIAAPVSEAFLALHSRVAVDRCSAPAMHCQSRLQVSYQFLRLQMTWTQMGQKSCCQSRGLATERWAKQPHCPQAPRQRCSLVRYPCGAPPHRSSPQKKQNHEAASVDSSTLASHRSRCSCPPRRVAEGCPIARALLRRAETRHRHRAQLA